MHWIDTPGWRRAGLRIESGWLGAMERLRTVLEASRFGRMTYSVIQRSGATCGDPFSTADRISTWFAAKPCDTSEVAPKTRYDQPRRAALSRITMILRRPVDSVAPHGPRNAKHGRQEVQPA